MNTKIKRRVLLGAAAAFWVAAPLVVVFRRKKHLEMGPESELVKFRQEFQESVAIPRTYTPVINKQLAQQPQDVIDKVIAIHRRQWEQFSKIDEIEFDYYYMPYHRDGRERPSNFSLDAHIRVKYGYGYEIEWRRLDTKEKIHWVFNMDGDVTGKAMQEMNISSLALSFFQAFDVLPESCSYTELVAENIDLPENPFIKGHGKYDLLRGFRGKDASQRVTDYCRSGGGRYVSRENGGEELMVVKSFDGMYEAKYGDASVPLPPLETVYVTRQYTCVNECFLPSEIIYYYADCVQPIQVYRCRNITVKKLA